MRPEDFTSLQQIYEYNRDIASDINEHLPRLCQLAKECHHITEMGTRYGVSTSAFLYAQPKKLVCYDIHKQDKQIELLDKFKGNTEFIFKNEDVLKVEIEETDLLFIDTFHVYEQMAEELRLHGHKARKYLVMHDTTICETMGEDIRKEGIWRAIREYVELNGRNRFSWHERYWYNCGLTILKRNIP